jgi:hypothetical protein
MSAGINNAHAMAYDRYNIRFLYLLQSFAVYLSFFPLVPASLLSLDSFMVQCILERGRIYFRRLDLRYVHTPMYIP